MTTLCAVFVSAVLLFAVQPMVAKMLLPAFGGAPAVWNTCLVFYQTVLLLGYVYAHGLASRFSLHRQVVVHSVVLLLALAACPIAVDVSAPNPDHPVMDLCWRLAKGVGLPLFALAGGGSLLQSWFAASGRNGAKDPYFLYAASNLGSLSSLLAYPLLVEPSLRLTEQGVSLAVGFGLLLLLSAATGVMVLRSGDTTRAIDDSTLPDGADARPKSRERGMWLLLSFLPCSLMMGVTLHVTTEIAPVPLLWLVPLSLYLLAFSLAFARSSERLTKGAEGIAIVLGVGMLFLNYSGVVQPVWLPLTFPMLTLLALSLACLARLGAMRPRAARLTEYYLWIALGGVLAGVFNAVIAPLVFERVLEYPIVLVATLALIAGWRFPIDGGKKALYIDLASAVGVSLITVWVLLESPFDALNLEAWGRRIGYPGWSLRLGLTYSVPIGLCLLLVVLRRARAFGLSLIAFALVADQRAEIAPVLYRSRGFFGVLAVKDVGKCRHLMHGRTLHGTQLRSPEPKNEPLDVYAPDGPLGDLFRAFSGRARPSDIATIGLGAGALATYVESGQHLTFYEIDPDVVQVARTPALFTFLSESRARVSVVLGDARVRIQEEPKGRFGLILVDAFSSNAIPLHLITREAIAIYMDKVAPHGALALHISNRSLDLEPFVGRIAGDLGLVGRVRRWEGKDACNRAAAIWTLLARTPADLLEIAGDARWRPLLSSDQTPLWTDDFSNLFAALDFSGRTR